MEFYYIKVENRKIMFSVMVNDGYRVFFHNDSLLGNWVYIPSRNVVRKNGGKEEYEVEKMVTGNHNNSRTFREFFIDMLNSQKYVDDGVWTNVKFDEHEGNIYVNSHGIRFYFDDNGDFVGIGK